MSHERRLESDAILFAAAIAQWDDEGGAVLSESAKNNSASGPRRRGLGTWRTASGAIPKYHRNEHVVETLSLWSTQEVTPWTPTRYSSFFS